MPIYYHDFDPWKAGADRIAAGMIAVNNARARNALASQEMAQRASLAEQERQQRQPVFDSQVESNRAGARRDNAAAALDEGLDAAYKESEANGSLGQAFIDVGQKKTDTPAIRSVLNTTMRASGNNPQRAIQSMGEMFRIHAAAQGNARESAIYDNPSAVVNNDADNETRFKISESDIAARERMNSADNVTRERMGFNVPANTVRMNAAGETIGTGLLNINRGNRVMSLHPDGAEEVAQGNPVQAPSGSNPYTDTVKYLNRKIADYITANGKPNERTKQADRDIYFDLQNELADALKKERKWGGRGASAAPSTAAEAMLMTNPDGKTVRVPADKVEWAKANGYR